MNKFEEWLNSTEGLEVLEKVTDRICKKYPSGTQTLVKEINGETFEHNDIHDLILSELWRFLIEINEKSSVELADLILKEDFSLLGIKIYYKCCSHVRDKTRDTLYRSVRAILHQTPKIYYQSDSDKTSYAFTDEKNIPVADSKMFDSISYKSWSIPPNVTLLKQYNGEDQKKQNRLCLLDKKGVNSKGVIETARFFWLKMKDHLEGDYVIPIRELVRYIRDVYPFYMETENIIKNKGDDIESGNIEIIEASWEDIEPQMPLPLNCIKQLNEEFFNSLEEKEKRLFCNRRLWKKTLAECAVEMGWKSKDTSKVEYRLKRFYKKVRSFYLNNSNLRDSDGESDLSEDVGGKEFINIIIENMMDLCKKTN